MDRFGEHHPCKHGHKDILVTDQDGNILIVCKKCECNKESYVSPLLADHERERAWRLLVADWDDIRKHHVDTYQHAVTVR